MATQRAARFGRAFGGLGSAGFLLVNVGCGLMHPASARDGDPLLGNFNRPIVRTPMPTGAEIGGPINDHNVYPAPAVGEGIRPPIPGAPPSGANPFSGRITQNSVNPGVAAPNTGVASGTGGPKEAISRFFGNSRDTESTGSFFSRRSGATIPLTNRFIEQKPKEQQPSWIQPSNPGEVKLRGTDQPAFASGASIIPDGPQTALKPAAPPAAFKTVEEGQTVLASYGVKWQRLERVENGEWQYTCGLGNTPDAQGYRQYAARNPDQVGAVRAVLEQVQKDK